MSTRWWISFAVLVFGLVSGNGLISLIGGFGVGWWLSDKKV